MSGRMATAFTPKTRARSQPSATTVACVAPSHSTALAPRADLARGGVLAENEYPRRTPRPTGEPFNLFNPTSTSHL